jgi:tetrahydrodipicolinate N-succinyltransferase
MNFSSNKRQATEREEQQENIFARLPGEVIQLIRQSRNRNRDGDLVLDPRDQFHMKLINKLLKKEIILNKREVNNELFEKYLRKKRILAELQSYGSDLTVGLSF